MSLIHKYRALGAHQRSMVKSLFLSIFNGLPTYKKLYDTNKNFDDVFIKPLIT